MLFGAVSAAALLAGCATAPTPTQVAAVPPATAGPTRVPPPTVEVTPSLAPGDLSVFAASSLTDAFTEIGVAFEAAHPGATVVFNFAGSQVLRTQIEEGAPADVFASANTAEMDALVSSGSVSAETCQIFAGNRLVVITAAGVSLGGLEDLALPGLKIVLAAEEVPVGKYSRQALQNLNQEFGATYADGVMANVVSLEENVRQVLAKVALGEADAGIVYATDAATEPTLATISIQDPYNVLATYPLAIVADAPRADLGQAFVEFVTSPQGQDVLAGYGFLPGEVR
jgi:molybdate transport system substrate-binding protein